MRSACLPLLFLATSLGCTSYVSPSVTDVDATEAWDLSRKAGVLVLDVRTNVEFDAGHIRGAKNIHYKKLAARIKDLAGKRNSPILVHCTRGVRSAWASKTLDENGFKKIYHFRGGMDAWSAANYPVIKETHR